MSDEDLIRDYVRDRSGGAFATLVERHLNLVYSVARRHVRSAALAEEVAQMVFVDLARDAARLKSDTPLIAWLHLVARRTAIDVVRREARRHAREQIAAEMADAMKTPEPAWTEVEPLLDEAVESLAPPDRTAILLRFFENKSLREVGTALGTSDDAAQKRVSRAVDELRAFFVRRGVAITATGLATTLAAHAIVTAPVGLGAAITSATGLAAATANAAHTLAMTTLQKSLVAASVVLVVGAGLREAAVFARQRPELGALHARTESLAAQLQRVRTQHDTTTAQLKAVETQIDLRLPASAANPGDAAMESQARTWLATLGQLQGLLDRRPELRIPEAALLTDEMWFNVAATAKLDTDEGIRRAFSTLRQRAENAVAIKLSSALNAYLKQSGGVMPDRMEPLLPFFDPPIEPALLERFEVSQTGKVSDLAPAQRNALITLKTPMDVEHDMIWQIMPGGFGARSAMAQNVTDAQRAFGQANGGRTAATAGELAPYLRWPTDPLALQKYLSRRPAP